MADDTLGFEPIDDELRLRLGASRDGGDPEAALAALRPRYRRAKRRHQLIVAGGSALAIVAILGVGTAVLDSGGSGAGHVRIPPATRVAPDHPATTTLPPGPTAPSTAAPGVSNANGPVNTSPAATTPTDSTPPASTQTYASDGGSLTVKLDNGALSIISTAPAAGYSEERTDTGPDRIEVRFKNDETEWRIRVDLVNGRPVEQVSQH